MRWQLEGWRSYRIQHSGIFFLQCWHAPTALVRRLLPLFAAWSSVNTVVVRILRFWVLDWIVEKRNHMLWVEKMISHRRVIFSKRPFNNSVLFVQFLDGLVMRLSVVEIVKEFLKFIQQEVLLEEDANVPLPSWKQWECITAGLDYQIAG